MKNEDEILTTGQVAKMLDVSLRRVQKLIADGRLPSQQFGREHLIKKSDVERLEIHPVGRPRRKEENIVKIKEERIWIEKPKSAISKNDLKTLERIKKKYEE